MVSDNKVNISRNWHLKAVEGRQLKKKKLFSNISNQHQFHKPKAYQQKTTQINYITRFKAYIHYYFNPMVLIELFL